MKIHDKMNEKATRGLPGDTLGPPRVHFGEKGRKRELIGRHQKQENHTFRTILTSWLEKAEC
jgi:hypothetical protein